MDLNVLFKKKPKNVFLFFGISRTLLIAKFKRGFPGQNFLISVSQAPPFAHPYSWKSLILFSRTFFLH